MKKYIITTGTVTYAIKGRDLLRRKGFKVRIVKSANVIENSGCGYAIILENGDITAAEKLLRNAGVKILSITEE